MPIRDVLRADLKDARKTGASELATLIRTLLAAVENAEAVDASMAGGASEVARRHLTDGEITAIILHEADDLRVAADEYDRHNRPDEADRLRRLSEIAKRYTEQMHRDSK
jgi:hypothetical protein